MDLPHRAVGAPLIVAHDHTRELDDMKTPLTASSDGLKNLNTLGEAGLSFEVTLPPAQTFSLTTPVRSYSSLSCPLPGKRLKIFNLPHTHILKLH